MRPNVIVSKEIPFSLLPPVSLVVINNNYLLFMLVQSSFVRFKIQVYQQLVSNTKTD